MRKNKPPRQAISMEGGEQARLFFALWPDSTCRNQLAAAAKALTEVCGGRRVRTETLHMTLLFAGSVDRALIPALESAAAGVSLRPFQFTLDHLACWRNNRIACAAACQEPQALVELASQLRCAIEAAGVGFDRKPFVPHVTLLRNIERNFSVQPIPPVVWQVKSFALVESVTGGPRVRYRSLRSWVVSS